jgi:hypothetical protein
MTHNFTKRTLAGALAVLCAAGTVPAGVTSNVFGSVTALTAYAEAAASITGATVHEVATLDEFLSAAYNAEDGDTIRLTDSFTIFGKATIENGKSFNVDFNGNIIYFDGEGNYKVQSYLYINNKDTNITFFDRGHGGGMSAINPCVVRLILVNRGTVELLSGSYTGGLDTIRTDTNDAHVYIKGGYYDLLKEDTEGPFFRNNRGNYYLTGGYYTQRANMADTRFDLVEGHEYYETGYEEYVQGIRKTDAVSIYSKSLTIEPIADQKYTGRTIKPDVIIDNGTAGVLEENVDYTVSYSDNTEVGTATVYINGIGNFYGSATVTFKIKDVPKYNIPSGVKAPFGSTLASAELPKADNGTWKWENSSTKVGGAGTKNFKATFVPNDTEHYLTVSGIDVPVTVYHTYKKVKAVEPTCTKDGNIEFYICTDGKCYTDNKGVNEIALADTVLPATGHSCDEPEWTWSDMTSTAAITAKATFKCKECRFGDIVDAVVTAKVVNPTYTADGKYVYTATAKFDGKAYTSTKEVAIPMLKLTHVEAVAPTCTKKGNIEYWYDEANNKYFADENGVNEITKENTIKEATGHNLSDPVWNWSKNYSSATLSANCSDCNSVLGTTAVIKSVKTEPTYTKEGKIVYTATAKFEGKTYTDTKEVRIPKLVYNAPEITHEQGYGAVKLSWKEVEGAEKYAVVACISGRWSIIGENKGTSYVMNGLKEGQEYKVAVIAYAYGEWVTNVTNAIVVSPKDTTTKYPSVTNIDYNEEYHQFRVTWTKVKGAQNYGVAVYQAGRWVILDQKIPASTPYYTSPKLKAGQTYKMVICAKVGGKWDTSALNSRTFEVTVK